MLKKFFISMLGSMAALWLSMIILFFMLIFGGVALALKSSGGGSKSGQSVLHIQLSGTIQDRYTTPSIYRLISEADSSLDDLETIIEAIDAASKDKKIKGIYLECTGASVGTASRGEIIDAIKRFKKSGKWVYAYADNYEQGDYYIASVADSLYLNPAGELNVHGLASQVMFFKNILDRLGIDVNIVRVGEFKSAVEPFMLNDMSEASRLQTTVYLSQIWGVITKAIASNRDLPGEATVNEWADDFCFSWEPSRYVQQKAVTRLVYRSEFDDIIRKLTGTDADKDLPLVTPSEYLKPALPLADSDHVAVLYAVGDITTDGDGISSESLVPEILKLAGDKHVKGLVMRVNSPGGSAFASEQIWKALQDFKATGKPFYVSMGDYAASGGYYISCGADSIYCDRTTITGSIGIFGIIPNAKRLIQDKIGVKVATVQTNPNATFPSLYEAPTSRQLASMQSYVERGYETFVSRVAQGRDIPVDSVKAIGGGRVWDGISARSIGLVDGFANLHEVVKAMTDKVGVDNDRYQYYPVSEFSAFDTLIKEAQRNIEVGIQPIAPRETQALLDYVQNISHWDPLQARMETIILK